MLKRLLTTTVAGAALAAGSLSVAAPAHAGPGDGQGCVGTPTIPLTYVCVISVDPKPLLPNVTITPVPVTVPPICYFAGCTTATTVNVPIPNVSKGSGGNVVVLWHNGVYYPIAVEVDGLVRTVVETVNTLGTLADHYARVLTALVDDAYGDALRLYHEYQASIVAMYEELNGDVEELRTQLERALVKLWERINDPDTFCRVVSIVLGVGGDDVSCAS